MQSKAYHIPKFRYEVFEHYNKYGRYKLQWRKTRDPYKILVSEVMLQQTQVSRVEGKYREFLKAFPTVRALAEVPLADVLRVWSGLGYNRRAKFLHNAAKEIEAKYGGKVPREYASLRALPGVGDYTAKAVRVFAWNEPEILIETNIRTVFIHHFHKGLTFVEDRDILPIAVKTSEGQDPREWNWALMDYGAHLKQSGVRVNARSAHYTKQSKFEGSLRQVRGAILKAQNEGRDVMDLRGSYTDRFDRALSSLAREGLIST